MRVLVLCGDYWHPAQVARTGLSPLEKAGFEFDWVDNAQNWSVKDMASYPLIILTKSNNTSQSDKTPWMTTEVELAFQDYVRRGNGLVVIHSGSAEYAQTRVLRALLGGVFNHHPPQCPVTVELQKDHPLVKDSTPFTVFDEHYFMDMEPGGHVFLTTSSEHGVQPGGWSRLEGRGRVCVLTPGHNLEVWLHPHYQAIIQRALWWVGGETNS
jgi:type 1 glutamine amidotransferase